VNWLLPCSEVIFEDIEKSNTPGDNLERLQYHLINRTVDLVFIRLLVMDNGVFL
jgi:hypothetical protein